jgi:hypothetical protein
LTTISNYKGVSLITIRAKVHLLANILSKPNNRITTPPKLYNRFIPLIKNFARIYKIKIIGGYSRGFTLP